MLRSPRHLASLPHGNLARRVLRSEGPAIALATVLAACAFDLAHVTQVPAQLQTTEDRRAFELTDEVKVNIGLGYSRVLKKGTRWQYVGRIAQGEVYRTADQVLTVEASNIHEAYIVVSSTKLVGFYLPVEKSFSPLQETRELPLKELPRQ